ncbi:glycosyltransferase [Vibrio rotiferianus]|uniref:glycosyltransferase n=1 Tax=Vibrio rotiferianus TaxID=190895 RepID=UPI002893C8F0|nr:Glycosyl transferase family 2 [Vibrio rotiferianus]
MNNPLVSIILPVFNAERYISQTLESLIEQTYDNYELIILDDGSNDNSLSIIKSFATRSGKVKVISRENKGLIASLNELLSLCQGQYIARADADDIYIQDRIEKQVKYLQSNPDIAVVGTSYNHISENGTYLSSRRQLIHPESLQVSVLFGSPLAHPTVMINKSICGKDLYYDNDYPYAEDYELWIRLIHKCNYKIANISENLVNYRVHGNSVSSQFMEEQSASMVKALLNTEKFRSIKNRLPKYIDKSSLISPYDFYLITKHASATGIKGKYFAFVRLCIAQLTKIKYKIRYKKSLR